MADLYIATNAHIDTKGQMDSPPPFETVKLIRIYRDQCTYSIPKLHDYPATFSTSATIYRSQIETNAHIDTKAST